MKRIFSLLLSSILILTMIFTVACQSSKGGSSSSNLSSEENQSQSLGESSGGDSGSSLISSEGAESSSESGESESSSLQTSVSSSSNESYSSSYSSVSVSLSEEESVGSSATSSSSTSLQADQSSIEEIQSSQGGFASSNLSSVENQSQSLGESSGGDSSSSLISSEGAESSSESGDSERSSLQTSVSSSSNENYSSSYSSMSVSSSGEQSVGSSAISGSSISLQTGQSSIEEIQSSQCSSFTDSTSESSSSSQSTSSSQPIDYLNDFTVLNGSFISNNGKIVSTCASSLAIAKHAYANGTLELTLNPNGTVSDNGIVFSLTYPTGITGIWEGSGISYYFFFISRNGSAYLGKTDNGTWSELAIKVIPGFLNTKDYTIKVVKNDSVIICYVDGEKFLTYNDAAPLNGTHYGIRAGVSEIQFSPLSFTQTESDEAIESFEIINGSLSLVEDIITVEQNTLAFSTQSEMTEGTVSVDTSVPSSGEVGITFGYKNGEYYFFSVTSNKTIKLVKETSSGTQLIKESTLVAKYGTGANVNLSVIFGDKIYTYIDKVCLAMADTTAEGRVGIKSTISSVFIGFTTSAESTPIQADVILWGHSHMQLWDNYATDLAGYGTVINLGIGGTNTLHWERVVDELLSYNADTMIVMTGSNDVPNSSNDFILEHQDNIYDRLTAANPKVHIILITEFLQPCRLQFAEQTRELNQRYFAYEEKNDFITVVDAYDIALNPDGSLNEDMFRDIYHLKIAGYDILTPRVRAAIEGTYEYNPLNNYTAVSGSFTYDDSSKAFVASENSVMLRNNWFIADGEVSAVAAIGQNRSGIVFKYDSNAYYSLVIRASEVLLLKTSGGQETVLTKARGSYNTNMYYTLKATFEDGVIKGFVNGEEVLNFTDIDYLSGNQFGLTASNASVCKLDGLKHGIYQINIGDETNWKITESSGVKTYTTLKSNTLMMFTNKTFSGGMIEFDMTVNATTDEHYGKIGTGVVFGASALNVNNHHGDFYVFGRCPWNTVTGYSRDDGSYLWEDKVKGTVTVAVGQTYHYQFVWDNVNHKVYIYENGTSVAVTPLVRAFGGEYVGLYSDTANTVFTNIVFTPQTFVKEEYAYTVGTSSSWTIEGSGESAVYTSNGTDQILLFKEMTFTGGTVEFDMMVPSNTYTYNTVNGVIFGATTLTAEHSAGTYYVCGRGRWNDEYLCMSKNNGAFKWEDQNKVQNAVTIGKTYSYKFIWDSVNNTVAYYLDGEYLQTCQLSFGTGGQYVGLFTETQGVVISNLKFTPN